MNDEQITDIGREVGRRDLPDHILYFDRQQGRDSEGARVCQYDKTHGRLQMHGNGHALICQAGRGKDRCEFQEPVSR